MPPGYGPASGDDPSLRRPATEDPVGPHPVSWDTALATLRDARHDPTHVRLEGVHALKHAVRFGARLEAVCTPDRAAITALLAALAPDVDLPAATWEVDASTWRSLVPRPLPSPVLAVARRPTVTLAEVLAAPGRVVVLEQPRHLGNLGAAVRVAAAAGAAGLLTLGDADPWHPTAVRAAAGLHFALPVAAAASLPTTTRPVIALDPDGDDLVPGAIAADAVLLVGTERGGLTDTLRHRADKAVRLPMRPGVSSLNLATALAAALYGAGVPGGTVRGG